MPKLSERTVDRLRPPATGRIEVWDDDVPGLFVRVAKSGRKTYVVQYREAGSQKKRTLGNARGEQDDPAALPLSEARRLARELRDQIPSPRTQRRAGMRSVADLYKLWREAGAVADSTMERAESLLRNHVLPRLGDKRPEEITADDILDMMDAVGEPPPNGKGHPVAANRSKAYLSAMLAWACKRRYTTTNPCRLVEWKYPEKPKQRVYSREELAILWHDFVANPSLSMGIFRLTLATIQRPGEVMGMRWDSLTGLDNGSAVWVIHEPKNGTRHHVPLGSLAIEVLDELRPLTGSSPYVFPARFDDYRPMSSYRKGMQTVRRRCSVTDFAPHDLRRTGASWMETLGVERSVIKQVLNHAIGGATSHYVYSQGASPACRAALETWERFLSEVIAEV